MNQMSRDGPNRRNAGPPASTRLWSRRIRRAPVQAREERPASLGVRGSDSCRSRACSRIACSESPVSSSLPQLQARTRLSIRLGERTSQIARPGSAKRAFADGAALARLALPKWARSRGTRNRTESIGRRVVSQEGIVPAEARLKAEAGVPEFFVARPVRTERRGRRNRAR
jgi:hypothetical protein